MMNQLHRLRIAGMLAAASVALGVATSGSTRAGSEAVEAPVPAAGAVSEGDRRAESNAKSVKELAAAVRKSVVVVTYRDRDGKRAGLGSGFIVSPEGLIATNLHVIGEARPISVQTEDGSTYPVTSVHATDRRMDLALIRVEKDNLPALELGDSDKLQQGDAVVAVGNPRGLKHSVVTGVVSGRRTIDGKPVFQVAIPIEPGNSGGPLLDREGRVHGILTLKSLVTDNLGFAVRINALKKLIAKPNPVPMSRWLTIGTLDPKEWKTLFGARWRQRAGRVLVEGRGKGFGGRSLAVWLEDPPETPFEAAVTVRLEQQDGAAGLIFHSDGGEKHYGFYPSNGRLRLSRFDGPDVFSWQVLKEVQTRRYRPGEWNRLKVRLDGDRIQCFCNGELVIDLKDSRYHEGKVGLAKFRHTAAEFKQFRVAEKVPSLRPPPETFQRVTELVEGIPTDRPPRQELVDRLAPEAGKNAVVLREQARLMERRAERLRQLAQAAHQQKTREQLAALFEKDEEKIDLLRAALLLARLDNDEVDVDAYVGEVERMVREVSETVEEGAAEQKRLEALNRYLFEELGFHGGRTNYYHRSNSYLNEVIDDREGLPITLSVLYIEMARRLGLRVVGVGLPGHFLVRFEPKEGDSRLIDPFDRGRLWTREDVVRQVKQYVDGPFDEQYLAAQSKRQIVVRMLRNLMGIARDSEDAEGLLRYVEAVLAIAPDSSEDRFFRAVLRYQTDRIAEALKDTEWLLDERPTGVELSRVRQLHAILERTAAENGR